MANSTLRGKYFKCPKEVMDYIRNEVSSYHGEPDDSGYKRAKNILDNDGKISYEQLKRIKNYFDKYNGDKTDDEYKLNGGDKMQKWAEETLKTARDSIYNEKKTRMDAGEENMFKKTHSKDKEANPTRVRIPKPHKGSKSRNIMQNKTTYESEKKTIKYLIEYLTNNS